MFIANNPPRATDAERRFLRILFPMVDENGSREQHNKWAKDYQDNAFDEDRVALTQSITHHITKAVPKLLGLQIEVVAFNIQIASWEVLISHPRLYMHFPSQNTATCIITALADCHAQGALLDQKAYREADRIVITDKLPKSIAMANGFTIEFAEDATMTKDKFEALLTRRKSLGEHSLSKQEEEIIATWQEKVQKMTSELEETVWAEVDKTGEFIVSPYDSTAHKAPGDRFEDEISKLELAVVEEIWGPGERSGPSLTQQAIEMQQRGGEGYKLPPEITMEDFARVTGAKIIGDPNAPLIPPGQNWEPTADNVGAATEFAKKMNAMTSEDVQEAGRLLAPSVRIALEEAEKRFRILPGRFHGKLTAEQDDQPTIIETHQWHMTTEEQAAFDQGRRVLIKITSKHPGYHVFAEEFHASKHGPALAVMLAAVQKIYPKVKTLSLWCHDPVLDIIATIAAHESIPVSPRSAGDTIPSIFVE